MHILLTVNSAWNVWNFRRPVVEAFANEGHTITVLAPQDDSVPQLKRLGCYVRPLKMSVKGINPIHDIMLYYNFLRIFREERPDIIFSFTIKNNIFGCLAAKKCGIPIIPNITGLGTAFLSGGFLRKISEILYKISFMNLSVVFFQNSDDRDLFLARGLVRADQTQVLPGSGIDLDQFPASPMPMAASAPTFLMISRLLRDKGVVEFAAAARMIKSRYPQVRFQLLGEIGSENRSAIHRRELEAWVEEGVIDYLGTTSDVRPVIAAANCVVLPSYREGAPRTLIEAAAMAKPLIATNVPGCRAVVDRDVSGLLCEARSAASLADAFEKFLGLSPEAQRLMGAAGRSKMEREFDQLIVVKAYRTAISNLSTNPIGVN